MIKRKGEPIDPPSSFTRDIQRNESVGCKQRNECPQKQEKNDKQSNKLNDSNDNWIASDEGKAYKNFKIILCIQELN